MSVRRLADEAGTTTRAMYRRLGLTHPNLFHLAFEQVELSKCGSEEAAGAAEAMSRLGQRVRRCVDAGLVGGHAVEFVATAFHALCQGLASMELRAAVWDPRTGEVIWEDALTALMHGLGQSDGRAK